MTIYRIPTNHVCIEIGGPDARRFLNGVLSNNIRDLKSNAGCYSLILSPKGKILGDLFIYAASDAFWIVCETIQKDSILTHLTKHVIFSKVRITDRSTELTTFTLAGDGVATQLEEWGYKPPASIEFPSIISDAPFITLKKWWNMRWAEITVDASQREVWHSRIADFPEMAADDMVERRVLSQTPLFSVDMDETTIPQEAGLHHALSFNKGCYIGQEIVTRLEHRGHVSKQLRLFKCGASYTPSIGDDITTTSGEKAGVITSVAQSPKHNVTIALAMVAYRFLAGDLQFQNTEILSPPSP